jgi:hypothetical protein
VLLAFCVVKGVFAAQPSLETKVLQESEFWSEHHFPLAQKYGKISFRDSEALWHGLGNSALGQTWERGDSSTVRQNMMALSSYEHWFSEQAFSEGKRSVAPTFYLCYAFEVLKSELSKGEEEKVRGRLGRQLEKYGEVILGEWDTNWWPLTNHVDFLPHLAAMGQLCEVMSKSRPHTVKLMKEELFRQWSKVIHLIGAEDRDGLALGVADSIWADWALMTLLDTYPKEGPAKLTEQYLLNRLPWYKAIILPGQGGIWGEQKKMSASVPWLPCVMNLARLAKSEELQHLALHLLKDHRSDAMPWAFLAVDWHDENLGEDIDHAPAFVTFPESGWSFGRTSRRMRSSHFTFLCGQPGGATLFEAWLRGRENMSFDHVRPNFSSWSWFLNGRRVVAPIEHDSPKTQDFAGMMSAGHGQWFEDYPRYRSEHWRKAGVGSTYFVNETHGESWLLGGAFAHCYPTEAKLERYDRVMLWLGASVLMEFSRVKTIEDAEVQFFYPSPDYPLAKRPDGFYQKVSGIQLKSASFPQGSWKIGQVKDARGREVDVGAETYPKVREWNRCVLMASSDLVQDAWIESAVDGIHLDFFKNRYQVVYRFEENRFIIKVEVNGKIFFDLERALPR